MPCIIFGWWAQISTGSIPLPRAGSRPVMFVIPLRMNRYTILTIGPACSCGTP
jgi:hypothetical protein